MIRCYDSTVAADIPTDAPAVAGYVDGRFAWLPTDWDRFPNRPHLSIAVLPTTNDGDVLDVEAGNATADQAPAWVAMRRAAGLARPVIYTSASNADAVRFALTAAGQHADLWLADWGIAEPQENDLATDVVGIQWADPATGSGGHWDLSVFRESFLAPVAAPWIDPTKETDTMQATDPISGTTVIVDPAGETFSFGPDGEPGGSYWGGLTTHPDFNAGEGHANGPVVGILFVRDGCADCLNGIRSAMRLICRDASGKFHPYQFPSDLSLAK